MRDTRTERHDMPKLRANQIAIEFDSFGPEDAEPILLISGLGTQMIRWSAPFCTALVSHGYRVIRFDNRDAGLSTHLDAAPIPDLASVAQVLARGDKPNVPYTLFDMANDAIGLLDGLSIERAHIVGRSMGGMIAQLVACEYPHRTRSLTSIMSGSGNPASPPPAPQVMALLTRQPPHPHEDEAGFLAHRMAFARLISGRGFRSTKLSSVAKRLPKFGETMIRRGSAGRSQPSRPPAISANAWQKSACQRWSCTDRMTR
jgi:pimeloyl-ACP methyl ester carboxylesterase